MTDEADKTRKMLHELKHENIELRGDIAVLKINIKHITHQIVDLKAEIDDLRGQVRRVERL